MNPLPGGSAADADPDSDTDAGWRTLTISRPGGLQVRLADLGATWLSCRVPLADGSQREVLLGNDERVRHQQQRAFLGVTVGRYANRIAHARFMLDARQHLLAANEGRHQLHGGPEGFDKRRWHLLSHRPAQAVFSLHSPDGDQGFPGAVDAQVTYRVGEDGFTLHIEFDAVVSQPTPLALTNHAYLNLDAQHTDVRGHGLQLAASHFVPVDAELIPCGEPTLVDGTDFDFRQAKTIARDLGASPQQQRVGGGYDHAFALNDRARAGEVPAAELRSSDGRLAARLYTDQPALQVYTGNHLAGTPGRAGVAYANFAGIALEPGLPPDAPNRLHWPIAAGAIARPGQPWHARLRWQFVPTPPTTTTP